MANAADEQSSDQGYYTLDPKLMVSLTLAEAEALRMQAAWLLNEDPHPGESPALRDLSPLGR